MKKAFSLLLVLVMLLYITSCAVGPQGPKGNNGIDGEDGADGLSAYEIAVKAGFKGTESEWLESLVGENGEEGASGVGIKSVELLSTEGLKKTYMITLTDVL